MDPTDETVEPDRDLLKKFDEFTDRLIADPTLLSKIKDILEIKKKGTQYVSIRDNQKTSR